MKSIIEELWYGNICPAVGMQRISKEVRAKMTDVSHLDDSLRLTLNDTQKEILEKYESCYTELSSINERDSFIHGFQLGARIAIEIMSIEKE